MKVLLASTGTENFSGASKCLIELALQLERKGIDVLISVPDDKGDLLETLEKNNLKYIVIKEHYSWWKWKDQKLGFFYYWSRRIANNINIVKASVLLKKSDIDVVHVNASTAYVTGKAAELAGIPVIWHIREVLDKDLGIFYTNPSYSYKVLNRANRMIGISETVKSVWNERISTPINVVYDGVPIENYYVNRCISDSKEDSDNNVKIGIYGRITPGKGQLFFFEGIKKLIDLNICNIHVFWAGKIEDKEYYQQIVQYISDNGLDEYQEYIGQISDIKSYLTSLDLVCVCSKFEGFGRVTVESQIAGCIVLGADIGATTEIIQHNKNGYLYKQNDVNDFADKLKYIITHIDDARKIALAGQKEAVNKYSIETDVNKVINVYNEVISEKNMSKKA